MIDKNKYENMNPNEFTQKDLMLHLLHVSQHTVTREDLKDDISTLDKKIDANFVQLDKKIDANFVQLDKKIDANFVQLDTKINKLESNMNKRFEQVDKRIDNLEVSMNKRFDKIDGEIEQLKTLEVKIKESKNDTIKWIVSIFFANIVAMAGLGFAAFKLFGSN